MAADSAVRGAFGACQDQLQGSLHSPSRGKPECLPRALSSASRLSASGPLSAEWPALEPSTLETPKHPNIQATFLGLSISAEKPLHFTDHRRRLWENRHLPGWARADCLGWVRVRVREAAWPFCTCMCAECTPAPLSAPLRSPPWAVPDTAAAVTPAHSQVQCVHPPQAYPCLS